mmetsp:Transcript_22754/g.61873  ORF Transcript_22754/g.61873 Transcript_22754/m.61873 type:complete len:136 (+) Transcript_22754:62-469(+)
MVMRTFLNRYPYHPAQRPSMCELCEAKKNGTLRTLRKCGSNCSSSSGRRAPDGSIRIVDGRLQSVGFSSHLTEYQFEPYLTRNISWFQVFDTIFKAQSVKRTSNSLVDTDPKRKAHFDNLHRSQQFTSNRTSLAA